jgi:hypothetical protein
MNYELITCHDSAAKAYLPVQNYGSIGLALRAFTDAANDPKHAFNAHPECYTLFHLGSFEDLNATFNIKSTPVALAKAIDLLNPVGP